MESTEYAFWGAYSDVSLFSLGCKLQAVDLDYLSPESGISVYFYTNNPHWNAGSEEGGIYIVNVTTFSGCRAESTRVRELNV